MLKVASNMADPTSMKNSVSSLKAKFSLGLTGFAMFGANLTWLHCWTTIIFGTVKDGSLLINTKASNNCLYHRNVFQNGVNTFSEMINQKLKIHFLPCDCVQIAPECGPNNYQIMYGETLDF